MQHYTGVEVSMCG